MPSTGERFHVSYQTVWWRALASSASTSAFRVGERSYLLIRLPVAIDFSHGLLVNETDFIGCNANDWAIRLVQLHDVLEPSRLEILAGSPEPTDTGKQGARNSAEGVKPETIRGLDRKYRENDWDSVLPQ